MTLTAQVKKSKGSPKTPKSKPQKKKAEVTVGPKLRLEPRLLPKADPKKNEDENKSNAESDAPVDAEVIIPDVIKFEDDSNVTVSKIKISSAQSKNCNALKKTIDSMKRRSTVERRPTRVKKRPLPVGVKWTDRDLANLGSGLQFHGFNEIKKVTDRIKTKTEIEVNDLINQRTELVRKEKTAETETTTKVRGRPKNKWSFMSSEHLDTWPNERKWRRIAYNQMLSVSRTKDYSRDVMVLLLKKFYDEEEEPTDPQVINTKAIYKYMMDSLAGEIPAQLPPKESFIMMDLFRDISMVPKVYDFKEEHEFLANYKGATKYRPFYVKDEFKKKKTTTEEEDSTSVAVTEDIFFNLSHHKRVVQSFNPLTIPVWMLQKEQADLEHFV